jgi:hypothetical protein
MSDLSFDTLTIRVPLKLKRHGGRKLVIVPEGAGVPVRAKAAPDDTLLKALARAHRWRRMLENGKASSINELAEIENINASYISRILRLTFLAPDIVTAILNGRQPRTLQLADMLEDVPVEWQRQREGFGIPLSK